MQDYFQKQLAINSNIFWVSNVSRSNSLMKWYKVAITGEPTASSLASSLLHVVSSMNQSNWVCPCSNDTNVSQFSKRYLQSHENKNKNNYWFTWSGFQDKFDWYDRNNNDESVELISSKQSKPLDQLKKSQEEFKNNKLLNLNEPIFRITKFRIRTVSKTFFNSAIYFIFNINDLITFLPISFNPT